MVKEIAYAKINLALEVMEKKDGYHMVNNIMIPIDLYDELYFEYDDNIYVVDDQIENNICVKAAKLILNHFNIKSGVKITLNKRIPIAAGLAGGSSDAAAVLKGVDKLYNLNASIEVLKDLASTLGSDVPFFIETKCALCTNRGEIINNVECNLSPINLYLIKPHKGTSTKEVYSLYKYEGISKKNNIDEILKSLKNNDKEILINNIFNDLTIPAIKANEELESIYNLLINKGFKPYISGSGPTIFIINPSNEEENLLDNLQIDTIKIKTKTK